MPGNTTPPRSPPPPPGAKHSPALATWQYEGMKPLLPGSSHHTSAAEKYLAMPCSSNTIPSPHHSDCGCSPFGGGCG
jgi:hypothetical protein